MKQPHLLPSVSLTSLRTLSLWTSLSSLSISTQKCSCSALESQDLPTKPSFPSPVERVLPSLLPSGQRPHHPPSPLNSRTKSPWTALHLVALHSDVSLYPTHCSHFDTHSSPLWCRNVAVQQKKNFKIILESSPHS